MRLVYFVLASLFLASVQSYDINAIIAKLSPDYKLEQGSFSLFNVSNCETQPSCFGNNPESPYIEYYFPSWGSAQGRLRSDEVILVIQAAPPQCRYFGFTPYIFSRVVSGIVPSILFASLSDTTNMNTVNIGSDGTITLLSSANPQVTSDVSAIISPFLPGSINLLPLPGQLLKLGTTYPADTFGYLSRYALFANSTQGKQYLNNIPGYVFKLTPINQVSSPLYPYPTYRPLGPTSKNESFLQDALSQLVDAVKASESGTALVQQAYDGENLLGYTNGFTCINATKNCNGDNLDARYISSLTLYIYNSSDSHTWVVGVQHQSTGKAVYTAVAATYSDKKLGVISVSDTKMNGSAQVFIPNNIYAPNLYAIKFSRNCDPTEKFCFVVPVDFPGVPLNATVSFTERIYVEPGYNVQPAFGSTLKPYIIRYRST